MSQKSVTKYNRDIKKYDKVMIQDDDKLLQELFSDYKPELNSGEIFMDSLNEKLDKVEYIKSVQEAQIRRYKIAVILSFCFGCIGGGVLSAFFMLTPINVPLFTFATTNVLLLTIQQYSRLISIVFLSGLISWGIIGIVGMIREISGVRSSQSV